MGSSAVKLLLDTHAVIWWMCADPRLSATAREAVRDPENDLLMSAASAWEMATKHRLGKLPGVSAVLDGLAANLRRAKIRVLPIDLDHAQTAGALPGPHRDPFDRLLMAQAHLESLTVVTVDPVFRDYGIAVLW